MRETLNAKQVGSVSLALRSDADRERGEREIERQEAPLALRPPQSAQTPGYIGVCDQRQGEINAGR